MKMFKYSIAGLLFAGLMLISSCKDESLNPLLEPETAVHGLGTLGAAPNNSFKQGDLTQNVSYKFKWNSIDGKNSVNKIQFFITFTEVFRDLEGNDRVANHGTKLVKTLEAGAVPANRTEASLTISQAEVLALFKDVTYDYKDGKGKISVFNASPKAARKLPGTPFISGSFGDGFKLTWALSTADGRIFDSWSDSVCGEFAGANCSISWAVK